MSEENFPWLKSYDEGVRWDIEIEPKPVYDILDQTAVRYAASAAFDFLGKKYNWGEIGGLVNRFAAGLQKNGLKKGDRVGLFLPNCPYFLIAYYGVLKAGGTVVNFNPLYAERELAAQIEDSETDIMVTADLELLHGKIEKMLSGTRLRRVILCRFTDILPFPKNILFRIFKFRELAQVAPSERIIRFEDLTDNDGAVAPVLIDPVNDIALLQYTGGTTGIPKGAMLTHYNVYANAVQSLSLFPGARRGEKKMLAILPFFHVFSMTVAMNVAILAGFEIIALPRFDLKDTLKAIHKHRVDFFPAVPAVFSAIINCPDLRKYNLSSLRYCISGGAALPVELKKKFEEITGCTILEGYGLTEASPVVCLNPQGGNMAGSIGLPYPRTIVEIIDLVDKKTPVPLGERGELCVRGPQVMKGYWKRPGETQEMIKDGRLHTGDIAVMDARGYVFIVDRLKDMIITNGYNVYPRNVEEAIYQHPSVEECIVAGLPDAQRGEIVKAWIKLKPGRDLNAEDLKGFLGDKISKMEIPRWIEFRNKPLPKTMIGKLSRKDVVAEEKDQA